MFKSLVRAALFGVVALTAGIAVAATYSQNVMRDGTNVWQWLSANNGAVSQMSLQNGGTTVLTIDPVNGVVLLSSLVSALPSCTAALTGAVRVVTDSNSTTVGGTVAGSGSNTVLAICNGTNWIND